MVLGLKVCTIISKYRLQKIEDRSEQKISKWTDIPHRIKDLRHKYNYLTSGASQSVLIDPEEELSVPYQVLFLFELIRNHNIMKTKGTKHHLGVYNNKSYELNPKYTRKRQSTPEIYDPDNADSVKQHIEDLKKYDLNHKE